MTTFLITLLITFCIAPSVLGKALPALVIHYWYIMIGVILLATGVFFRIPASPPDVPYDSAVSLLWNSAARFVIAALGLGLLVFHGFRVHQIRRVRASQ
jgi:uncharacterized membrane protein YczE